MELNAFLIIPDDNLQRHLWRLTLLFASRFLKPTMNHTQDLGG